MAIFTTLVCQTYLYVPAKKLMSLTKVINTKYYKKVEGLISISGRQSCACLYRWGHLAMKTAGLGWARTFYLVPEHKLNVYSTWDLWLCLYHGNLRWLLLIKYLRIRPTTYVSNMYILQFTVVVVSAKGGLEMFKQSNKNLENDKKPSQNKKDQKNF